MQKTFWLSSKYDIIRQKNIFFDGTPLLEKQKRCDMIKEIKNYGGKTTMNVQTAISNKINELMTQQGLSTADLSKLSKVSTKTIRNIVNNCNVNVTLSTISKLCKVLNISVSQFFDDIVNDPLLIAG